MCREEHPLYESCPMFTEYVKLILSISIDSNVMLTTQPILSQSAFSL